MDHEDVIVNPASEQQSVACWWRQWAQDEVAAQGSEADIGVCSGQVTEGSGRMLVVAVGTESEWGRTMALVATEAAPTPLQDALGVLATAIGKIGLAVGVICFLVLFARCGFRVAGFRAED